MPLTYPPAPPTLTGDVESINRFLMSPTLLTRQLRTLLQNRFISDVLLTGRYTLQGGAVLFEQSESIYTDRGVEQVAPGGEYSLSGTTSGLAAIAAAAKWGQDVPVTDEAIKRLLIDPVNRALVKLVNNLVKKVDSVSLAAIASAITQTAAATAAWAPGTASTNPLYDIAKGVAFVRNLNQGYDPDIVVMDDIHYAQLMNNTQVLNAMAREDKENPAYTGRLPGNLAGLTPMVSPNLPTAATAIIVDSRVLGGMADEDLGGPGYTGQLKGTQGKTIRTELNDSWRLRARRVTVPVVIEPGCGYVITAV